SNWAAFVNIVCVVAGTGVLQLPYALSEGGWLGIVLIFLSGFIGVYSGTILIRCLYYDRTRRLSSYPEVGEAAFGKPGLYITYFFHYLYILGTVCIYIILAGDNINGLLEQVNVHIGAKVCQCIVSLVMWAPFVVMKSMKEVAILALFGLVATVVVVVVAVVVGFSEFAAVHAQSHITYTALSITSLPSAIASISFAFSGNVVYPHVEASMKQPRDWPKVLTMGMVSTCSMYLLMAICGYAVYGNTTVSPILSNLRNGIPKTIALILISLHVILAAPIMLTTFALEIEKSRNITVERFGKVKEFVVRFIFRSLVVAALFGIAAAIPYFSDVLNLVGALSTTAVFFIFPLVWYVKLFGIGILNWRERVFGVVILILGVVGLVIGSIQAIQGLVK
ncbi:transmembrane amino acid transporter protein-domain-containing protein, partial [Dimargaris cristalligena]